MEALLEHLPGFLMPRLVREVPGRRSKTPLAIDGTSSDSSASLATTALAASDAGESSSSEQAGIIASA